LYKTDQTTVNRYIWLARNGAVLGKVKDQKCSLVAYVASIESDHSILRDSIQMGGRDFFGSSAAC
jgi:hypothetical protein